MSGTVPASMNDLLLEVPASLSDPMYQKVQPLQASTITTGVNGSGVFDALMTSMKAYLQTEYDKGRITGADYTHTYIALTQAALTTALQFVLAKDQSFWQAQQAQIAAVAARVGVETGKIQHDTAQYQLSSMLPAQLALINEQKEAARAQTLGTRSDGTVVAGSVGMQVQLYQQQITSYQRDAEVKASKAFTDAYITAKTLDNTITPPTNLTNATIDVVLSKIRTNNGFV